jgi:hypothetical protein
MSPKRLPKGCVEDRDRHGNIRIYYRGTKKIRLRTTPWTEQFMEEYEAAKAGHAAPDTYRIDSGTWRWLCVRYFEQCATLASGTGFAIDALKPMCQGGRTDCVRLAQPLPPTTARPHTS